MRQRAMFEKQRFDVTGEMMNCDEREVPRLGKRLREGDADQQRPDKARPLRHRHRVETRNVGRGLCQRSLDDAADIAHVLP